MTITLADSAGFCFGVKRAVDTVYHLLEDKEKKVYTLGPIIHNEQVVQDLNANGVGVVCNPEEISGADDNATLVIRSHGVSQDVIRRIKERGLRYEDATCPFVKKIHQTVEEYSAKSYRIIIIGSKDHPEVQGILGWTNGRGTVIETAEEARNFSLANPDEKICIVSQTTFNYKKFQELVEIISKKGYDINVVNTICNATEERQTEAAAIAEEVDAMIVIGGTHSSNTRKLFEICKEKCENTFYIQTLDDLYGKLPGGIGSVGITAGASTPNNIIEEVQNYVRINF